MKIISSKNPLQESKVVQVQYGLWNLACEIVKAQVPVPWDINITWKDAPIDFFWKKSNSNRYLYNGI